MRRGGRRILLALLVACGLWLAWVSTLGTPAATDTLPAGASLLIEAQDAQAVADRLADTRFAAAFARSASREWLEGTEAALALDSLLAEVRRLTGVPLGRRSVLDLIGTDAAGAWYPPSAPAGAPRWAAAGRLSLRAWAVAAALRLAERAAGGQGVVREEVAERSIYAIPVGGGRPVLVFLAGRMLVACSDRDLALRAGRAIDGDDPPMSRDPALTAIRDALPARGEAFVWARGDAGPHGAPAAPRSAGGRLKAGKTLEIELAAEPPAAHSVPDSGGPAHLPALALLRRGPVAFFSSRQPAPAPLNDLLQDRLRAAARRGAGAPAGQAVAPGRGYAVVLTESDGGSGLLPAPRGVVVLGMRSDAEARAALPLLFPPGARRSSAGGVEALASRESIPLAGQFDLWGAAVGSSLVFASDAALIAAAADPGNGAAVAGPLPGTPDWQVDAVFELSMQKALPLLQRWGPPLSALLAARWPQAPDVMRDLDLAASIRTVRAVVGSDGRRDRALVTLHLQDLP